MLRELPQGVRDSCHAHITCDLTPHPERWASSSGCPLNGSTQKPMVVSASISLDLQKTLYGLTPKAFTCALGRTVSTMATLLLAPRQGLPPSEVGGWLHTRLRSDHPRHASQGDHGPQGLQALSTAPRRQNHLSWETQEALGHQGQNIYFGFLGQEHRPHGHITPGHEVGLGQASL